MWYLLIPATVGVLSLVSKAKTGSFNPAELLVKQPAAAKPTIPSSSAAVPATGTPAIGPGVVTPGAQPGLGTIDGHGTGVLVAPVAGVPVPPVSGLDPNDPNAAAILAAATKAAQQIQQQQDPNATTIAAAAAAESIKQQIIAAMNTPQTDRTPEQLALLSGLAALPTT